MNQACEGALANSAVPVLPAMGTDASARRPVPEVTTSRMNLPSVAAASAVSTGWAGAARGLVSSVIQRPWHSASGSHGSGHARHLEGRRHHLALPV